VSEPGLEHAELRRRARGLGLVLTDCDGVLTDAGIYYSAAGEELRRFSVRDGMGVERLRERGIGTAIVTREPSEQILRRAEKLRIRAHLGVRDKVAALEAILAEAGVARGAVAFIGDDVNDLEAMRAVAAAGGLIAAPADAMPEVRALVHFRTGARGGHGAFRDFAEWIIALRASPE
jgi:3-deoxy-D-manno-octulosonate 8-phosphate phosphatase (KDO 8-P phosphatase)